MGTVRQAGPLAMCPDCGNTVEAARKNDFIEYCLRQIPGKRAEYARFNLRTLIKNDK